MNINVKDACYKQDSYKSFVGNIGVRIRFKRNSQLEFRIPKEKMVDERRVTSTARRTDRVNYNTGSRKGEKAKAMKNIRSSRTTPRSTTI